MRRLVASWVTAPQPVPSRRPRMFVGAPVSGFWRSVPHDCPPSLVPPPPCISYALVQATVGVGTLLIWDLILIRYQT